MIRITREMMEKCLNDYRNAAAFFPAYCTAAVILILIILAIFTAFEDLWFFMLLICAAIFGSIFIVHSSLSKKIASPEGRSRITKKAFQGIRYDYISDAAVNKLFALMSQTESFAEQTMVKLVLCNVYELRGEYDNAIAMLRSVNKGALTMYPYVALNYFDVVTDIYAVIGDPRSVIAAANDAEPFINEYAGKNYPCCIFALSILIRAERANADITGGGYGYALEMQLMKNDYMNRAGGDQGTPLSVIARGETFYETAELFFLNNDYRSAAQYLDMGGPLLAGSSTELARANALSQKIKIGLDMMR